MTDFLDRRCGLLYPHRIHWHCLYQHDELHSIPTRPPPPTAPRSSLSFPVLRVHTEMSYGRMDDHHFARSGTNREGRALSHGQAASVLTTTDRTNRYNVGRGPPGDEYDRYTNKRRSANGSAALAGGRVVRGCSYTMGSLISYEGASCSQQ